MPCGRLVTVCIVLAAATSLRAQTIADAQSTATPLGLTATVPVMEAGSDASSAAFLVGTLPPLTHLVNTQLGETVVLDDAAAMAVDPSRLILATEATVRVYFVAEGAGYHNSVLASVTAPSGADETTVLFPDASSAVSFYDPSRNVTRTPSAPLLPGDFVDLGGVGAGSLLDFLLVANGASGGTNVWSTDATANRDGLVHAVALAFENSPFLIIGFEDMYGGGDRDYNDVVLAIDIGTTNVARLTAAPEPGLVALVLMAGLVALGTTRKRIGDVPCSVASSR